MTDQEVNPTIMNVEEVADYLRVAPATVYRLAQRGEIPAAKVGRVWRFQKEAINRWLSEQAEMTSAPSPDSDQTATKANDDE